MSKVTLEDRANALEEKFFGDKDQELLQQLRAQQEETASAKRIGELTGLGDDPSTAHLAGIGVRPETITALSLIPLLYVAWGDNELDEAERKAILAEARDAGIVQGSKSFKLLSTWLTRTPQPELFATWSEYWTALRPTLQAEQAEAVAEALLARAGRIARASGGFLGIGSVSSSESAALENLERVLNGG